MIKFQVPTSNTFWDMNYYLRLLVQSGRQTDRQQTDRKQCIWAHRANCTGGLKNEIHFRVKFTLFIYVCNIHAEEAALFEPACFTWVTGRHGNLTFSPFFTFNLNLHCQYTKQSESSHAENCLKALDIVIFFASNMERRDNYSFLQSIVFQS